MQRAVVMSVPEAIEKFNGHHTYSGHYGILKTRSSISHKYYWPGMTKDIEKWISTCDVCQRFGVPDNADTELHSVKDGKVYWQDEDIAQEVIRQASKNKAAVEAAQRNIQKAQERQQKQYRERKTSKYSVMNVCVGGKVLLLNYQKRTQKGANLEPDYQGPYIVDRLEGRKVTLRTIQGKPMKTKYHISLVKPYKEMSYPVPKDHEYIRVGPQNGKLAVAPIACNDDSCTKMSMKECHNNLWQSAVGTAEDPMETWAKKGV
ncbi:uncharacterized protein LOC128343955 [Hemicordylus capensis]|uniref:uncharacterized protein LOC128343955 n=1 Tax=Hemicordylus capensis TaxID=884348 RepID=UPI0023042126|nr:uncharacterized protein LOC128343955 [Hemicordylus capensis]